MNKGALIFCSTENFRFMLRSLDLSYRFGEGELHAKTPLRVWNMYGISYVCCNFNFSQRFAKIVVFT